MPKPPPPERALSVITPTKREWAGAGEGCERDKQRGGLFEMEKHWGWLRNFRLEIGGVAEAEMENSEKIPDRWVILTDDKGMGEWLLLEGEKICTL